MALNLNDQAVRLPYEEFYGEVRAQMPKLLADKRMPLSVAGLMERRLNSTQTAEWRDNYFGMGDAIAYKGDAFKVVADAPLLRELTANTRLKAGAVLLADGLYETFDGTEFSRKDLSKVMGRDLTAADAKKHPVWQALARGDQGLLDAYTDMTFADTKARFGYTENMGVYLDDSKEPHARAWFVGRAYYRSQASGDCDLDYRSGRLVGVAPEALSAPGKAIVMPSLETALTVVNQHIGNKLKLQQQ